MTVLTIDSRLVSPPMRHSGLQILYLCTTLLEFTANYLRRPPLGAPDLLEYWLLRCCEDCMFLVEERERE